MDVAGPITHVPETVWGEFEAAVLGADYAKRFGEVELARFAKFLYQIIDQLVRCATERARERRAQEVGVYILCMFPSFWKMVSQVDERDENQIGGQRFVATDEGLAP